MFIYLIIIRNLWKINDNEGNEFQEIRKKKKKYEYFWTEKYRLRYLLMMKWVKYYHLHFLQKKTYNAVNKKCNTVCFSREEIIFIALQINRNCN